MTQFNPDETAVVIVDMQNDFAHPDGTLYAPASEDAIADVNGVLQMARTAGVPVVFTRDVHPEDQFDDAQNYDEFEKWGEHCVEGTIGAEIVDDITVEDDDFVVEKHTYNAFDSEELDEWLTENGIQNLIICGTLANVCVMHTAAGAAKRDYKPVVVTDALGYINEQHRQYAVDHTDFLLGELVKSADIKFKYI